MFWLSYFGSRRQRIEILMRVSVLSIAQVVGSLQGSKNTTLDDVVQIKVSGAMSKLSVDRTLQKAKSFAKKG